VVKGVLGNRWARPACQVFQPVIAGTGSGTPKGLNVERLRRAGDDRPRLSHAAGLVNNEN
jgi:hypothetical protein